MHLQPDVGPSMGAMEGQEVQLDSKDTEVRGAAVAPGAMDSFLGASEKRKTKKKLVERTFTDSKGYLGEPIYSRTMHQTFV